MVKYDTGSMFSALGLSIRQKMIERISEEGRLSISELARPHHISLPAALKHTEILEKSGLIIRSKIGRVQYCTINPLAFEKVLGWLLSQKSFWDGNLARLEKHINSKHK